MKKLWMSVSLISICLYSMLVLSCNFHHNYITGEVETTEIDVGVKIPGRISSILVKEGDFVTKGQLLGRLESKEIDAKLQAATAANEEAKKQHVFAQQSYQRIKNLYNKGIAPKQQFDEIEYKLAAAEQKERATLGQLNEVKAYYEELELKAPINGQVIEIISNEGEIVSSGYPIVTLANLDDQWVAFYLREDQLQGIHINDKVQVRFPAISKDYFTLSINYISSLGAFAKWKSTNEQGSFDLKTFEVRARSDSKIDNLRSGMTAVVKVATK